MLPATKLAVLAGAIEARRSWAHSALEELVSTPSVTGEEQAAQEVMARLVTELGGDLDVWCPTYEEVSSHPSYSDDGMALGERPMVVARFATNEDLPTLVLNGHIDVVPPGELSSWTRSPWQTKVAGDRLFGRGACDMKGGLVAGLWAIAALLDSGADLPMNLLFQSVIGEESCGVGSLAAVLRGHAGDAAVILEPTSLALCPVSAGAATFRITVHGLAAHGAMRDEGVSALEKWFPIADALRDLEAERRASFRHPAFDEGSLVAAISVGRVAAGDWPSTVPDRLVAEGRFGVLPGESLDAARHQFEEQVAAAAHDDPWLADHPPSVEWFEGQFAPAETPIDEPLVQALTAAHQAVEGAAPAVRGIPYGSDMRFFVNNAGVPAVLYGPGDPRVAHTADEYVELSEVERAARVLTRMVLGGLGA
jgi:acetylornithine deacetylase